jgi:uncharacterized protein (DUF983 family)
VGDPIATRRLILGRVLARSCPQCAARTLFVRYARLAATCSACGLRFRREQGSQTGSMYLTAVAGELFAAAGIGLAWWLFDWSTTTFVLVLVPLTLAFTVAFLPLSMALWVGIEYATDLQNQEPWVTLRDSEPR